MSHIVSLARSRFLVPALPKHAPTRNNRSNGRRPKRFSSHAPGRPAQFSGPPENGDYADGRVRRYVHQTRTALSRPPNPPTGSSRGCVRRPVRVVTEQGGSGCRRLPRGGEYLYEGPDGRLE